MNQSELILAIYSALQTHSDRDARIAAVSLVYDNGCAQVVIQATNGVTYRISRDQFVADGEGGSRKMLPPPPKDEPPIYTPTATATQPSATPHVGTWRGERLKAERVEGEVK